VTGVKAAGARIVGKTNSHELAMGRRRRFSHFGVPIIHGKGLYAGGSSGGSSQPCRGCAMRRSTRMPWLMPVTRLPDAEQSASNRNYGSISSEDPGRTRRGASSSCASSSPWRSIKDALSLSMSSPRPRQVRRTGRQGKASGKGCLWRRIHSPLELPGNLRPGSLTGLKPTTDIKVVFQRASLFSALRLCRQTRI